MGLTVRNAKLRTLLFAHLKTKTKTKTNTDNLLQTMGNSTTILITAAYDKDLAQFIIWLNLSLSRHVLTNQMASNNGERYHWQDTHSATVPCIHGLYLPDLWPLGDTYPTMTNGISVFLTGQHSIYIPVYYKYKIHFFLQGYIKLIHGIWNTLMKMYIFIALLSIALRIFYSQTTEIQ